MSRKICWLTVVLMVGFVGIDQSRAQDVVNLLRNGGFEDGVMTPWGIYDNTGGGARGEVITDDPIEGDYCLHIVVPQANANYWDVGLNQGGLVFESGKKYTLSAWLKCDSGTLDVSYKPELAQDPWTGFGALDFTITEEWDEYSTTTPVMTSDVSPGEVVFHIGFTPGELWVDGVRWYEGDYVAPPPVTVEERAAAGDPSPADGATNVPNDTPLSWTPGEFAATHDVYLGTSFEDVNNATRTNPMNVLVSKDLLLTKYKLHDALEFGQTYYWRIDEVNAPPDSTVYKGAVWSFTVEPYAFEITNIQATASSSAIDQGPENTINGSGLNSRDQHSTIGTDMWLSDAAGPQPTWIQYEFDKAYALLEMWVWNSNQMLESVVGIGAKDVTIEYSLDGENWTTLGEQEFAQATGTPTYTHNTTVDMSGVVAKYVRLTINTNWQGLLPQYGLSEVRFTYIPVQASDPVPSSGALNVPLDVVLDWRGGREAASHEVYLSTDEQAVIDGTAPATTVNDTEYQVGPLDYGQRYYWKVNEISEDGSFYEGDVWRFSTTEMKAVDDFESYTDDDAAGQAIWQTWIDGFGVPENGSQVGYLVPPYAERTIVHGGKQSMPFFYDHGQGSTARYSEAERTFDDPMDWTQSGIEQLSLWFRGNPGSAGSFVESPAGTFTMTGSGTDIWDTADQFHFAYKMLTGAGSIVARVQSVTDTDPWAKAGVMIRETLDPGSKNAFATITPENGVASQGRTETGGTSFSTNQTGVAAPYWVKLERDISGRFTVSHSANGTNWTPVNNATGTNIQMSSTVYIGLAVTSHNASETCEAVFTDVTMTGSVSGEWTDQDIGIATNDAEPLYVGLVDTAGHIGTVASEDPAATQIDTWTQWSIDLAQFADQGVNLAAVQNLILGVGDRNTPTAGGSGTLYFDDIGVGRALPPPEFVNLLVNGGFEDGVLDPWYIYDNTGGGATAEVVSEDPVEGSLCLHVIVPTVNANFWDVGISQPDLVFQAGKKYTLSAWLKCASGTLDINFKPELGADPYTGYGDQVLTMTDEWAEYHITTPVFTEDVSPGTATFHVGFTATEFWMDDVKFYEGDYTIPGGLDAVVVGDFEGGLDGWQERDATLSLSTTGATLGTQALQVDGPGDWHIDALVDIRSHSALLGTAGAMVVADVTAFDADLTTTWMNMEMIINGQNNDDNGANNNVGWQSLGAQSIERDGQPHTYTWAVPESLSTVIAGTDDNIAWFELALVSNLDAASVTKFYIDNIRLVAGDQ
jgi:hypothetical protein